MNNSNIKWDPETIKWLQIRNRENLVLFYSYELKKIQGGEKADLLLTNIEKRRLKQAGIITYNKGKAGSVEVSSWAFNILALNS